MNEYIKEQLEKTAHLLEKTDDKMEWLKLRRNYITGTDIAAIMGYSKYKSAYQVYKDKTADEIETFSNIPMEIGSYLEPYIRSKVADLIFEKEGILPKVHEIENMLESKEMYVAGGNIDGVIEFENELAVLEIKTVSEMAAAEWDGDNVPDSYYFQCMWYLYLTGLQKCYIVYLVGNRKIDYKVIPRNDEIIENMAEVAAQFWEHNVTAKIPPMMSFADTETLEKEYPQEEPGEVKSGDDETAEVVKLWREAETEKKKLDAKIEECKNRIKAFMGTAETAIFGIDKVTWKTQKKDGYFVKPSETRVLRFKEGK